MILYIDDYMLISDLQDKFNLCFPNLRIEFYSKSHGYKKRSEQKDCIEPTKRIGEISKKHGRGELEIKSWFTVARVEKDFLERFGLNVQVFRKENDAWVQTTKTDKYSLKKQNEMSSHAQHSIDPKYTEQLGEYDYL